MHPALHRSIFITVLALTAAAAANSASAQTPADLDLKARCAQLTSFYDRYGVSRSENSDGARSPTRVAAGLDCEKGQYEKGIAAMEALIRRKHFDVPPATALAQEPVPPLRPHGERRRGTQ